MRRASSSVLSRLSRSKPNSNTTLPQFHSFNTVAAHAQIPTIQQKDLEDSFDSATSTEEMLVDFDDMEAIYGERDLGLAALKLGLKLHQQGDDPEKTLSFAMKALRSLVNNDEKTNLSLATTLQLLASASYSLRRFSHSLGYLDRAKTVLGEIEEAGSCNVDDIRPIMHAIELELANTKTTMGRREEALGNLRTCLELKALMLVEDSKELGDANRDLAEAYVAVLDFKGALPFCVKALEIHRAQLGQSSVEVAHDRRILGVIYTGLEEHEKALQQNQLSQEVLKNWGLSSDLLRAEIDAANIQIALGRYEEAVNTLKTVVQHTDKESYDRDLLYVCMGKAMCNQGKYSDAKRCMEIACGILDKKEATSPREVSEAYIEISMAYEMMNEFENAIKLLRRAQGMLNKLPQEQHSEGRVWARIGWLLLLTGKVKKAILYLEGAAGRMRQCFGSKYYGVGYVYNNLGAAYLELDRPQSAAQMFAVAKDIIDVSLGPAHVDTIEACQNLSKAYGAMGRGMERTPLVSSECYQLAMKFQEQVIEAWEGHGPSADGELKEAIRIREELKKCREVSLDEQPVGALLLNRGNEFTSTRSTQPYGSFGEKRSSVA